MFTPSILKMKTVYNLITSFCLLAFQLGFAQQKSYITEKDVWFDLEVRVVDKTSQKSIKNAKVSVDGRRFKYDLVQDYYRVRARVNQQLVVSHAGFETVYHIIKSNEEIKVEVEDFDQIAKINKRKRRDKRTSKFDFKNAKSETVSEKDIYFKNLDSALYYKEKDIEKSLSFVEKILKESQTEGRSAAAYNVLGDIYFEWKQYDLAISNYKNSLQYRKDESIKLPLAKAAFLMKRYREAETYLKEIDLNQLGVFQKIQVYESLGNIYLKKKEFEEAKVHYKKALKIANDHETISKVTALNAKLGDVLVAQGDIEKANLQFQNTIELAKKESPLRSITTKERVANYYNSTQQLDKEIQLRKETLEETKTIPINIENDDNELKEKDGDEKSMILKGFVSNNGIGNVAYDSVSKDLKFNYTPQKADVSPMGYHSINSQSINYKIGRALVQKEDYQGAIPFLKKSIEDASKSNDLIVKKDATKKLSEVYENVGEYNKAYITYRTYANLVDTLYIRKEQEIEQAKRFAKRIAENRNRIASLEKDKELTESKVSLAMKDQQLSLERNKGQQYVIYSLLLGIIAMVVFTYLLFRSNQKQKLANNLLALKSMRSQMNPHFIFNALNSVNSFIAVNDERNANRYLSEFSVLMRSVLENSDEDFIPFSKEIELIELYVKLEHNRFKEKFDYSITIDEAIDLDEYTIPPMLLQPYIENAIWHGLRYKDGKGTLEIVIGVRDDTSLVVTIRDNGVGRKRSQELKTKNQLKQKSKGMSTIKKRISILNDMYQDKVSVAVSDLFEDGTGTKVALLLKKNN